MCVKSKTLSAGLLAAALLASRASSAATLVNYQILGNTDGSSNYVSSLAVKAGDVVHYEVLVSMAPLGTTNGTKTINSLTLGTDGMITSAFNLVDTTPANIAGSFSQAVLSGNAQGPSSSSGTVGTNALNGIKAAVDTTAGNPGFGVVATNTPGNQLVLTGTFTVGTGPTGTSTIGETFSSAGSFKINGGSSTFVSTSAQDSSFDSFSPLTLSVVAAPEPATLALAGIAVLGFLVKRSRTAL